MSLGALLALLGANAAGMTPVQLERSGFDEGFPSPLAAESSIATKNRASSDQRDATDEQADLPAMAPPDVAPPQQLVMRVGDRRTGPELELGALGRGRARIFSLVRVGFGFDF